MEIFGFSLMFLVYISLILFLIKLAIRFVEAFEKISTAIERIADKYENK